MDGDMDGMDDMNAPMPPMGPDQGMPPMDDPMGGGPSEEEIDNEDDSGMGPEPGSGDDMGPDSDPMNDNGDDEVNGPGNNGNDSELIDTLNSLDLGLEDQAAIAKYAKAIGDKNMEESKFYSFKRIIDETIDDFLNDSDREPKRPETKMNGKKGFTSPFKSPY